MPKKKPAPARLIKNTVHPWVNCAVICERVLREEDNVFTVVRIIDKVTIQGESPGMPPGVIRLAMFVLLKSDKAVGNRDVKIKAISPTSEQLLDKDTSMNLTGGEQGGALVIELNLGVKRTGLYWFEVSTSGKLLARVPLKIEYKKK